MGLDYYLNDYSTLGFSFRNWNRKGDGTGYNDTKVNDESGNILIDNFITENITTSKRKGTYYSTYFKRVFNKNEENTLNIDFDFNKFKNNNINDLAIYSIDDVNSRSFSQQDVNQPVDLYVGKIDYSLPIDSTFKLETGAKSSFARVDNQLNFYREKVLSNDESNYFLFEENINAAYINLSKSVSKIDFSGGLRMEETNVKGSSEGVVVLDRSYNQWFPSASAIYHLNKNIGIQTAYSKRVNRPGFSQQNPLVYFIDSLTFTRGNPQLRPEISHTTQLNVTYDGQPIFGVAYSRTNDVIIENAPEIEGSKAFTTAQNLAQNSRLEIQLNFPINFGKVISGYGGNQFILNSYDADYLDNRYEVSKWNWLAYWQINASLPYGINAECGGFYITKFLEEFLVIDQLAGVNVGLSKKFANDQARVSLSLSDVFYNQKTKAVIAYDDIRVNFFERELSRLLRLNMSYTFGNTNLKSDSRKNASATESSRVKIE
jgi:outer membrane receptor protein involved in Fe transport